jgi:hypothetical protein
MRVRLAVRLDAQLHARSKSCAERTWLLRNAEAAGIEISDEEASNGDGGAAPAGTGDGSSAAEIQRVCADVNAVCTCL